MANWTQQNSRITSDGIKLLAKARAGEGQMVITRVLSRDFVQTSVAVIAMRMEEITPESIKQEGIIVNSYATNGTSIITARFSNVQNRDRSYSYEIKQIIVLAKLVNEGVEVVGEIPYIVLQCGPGDTQYEREHAEGDLLPPLDDNPTTFDYKIHVVHSGITEVNVQVSTGDYASEEELEQLASECLTRDTQLGVRINKVVADAVGQKTEDLTFIPWKPSYDDSNTWSRELNSDIPTFDGQTGGERFNYYNEDPEEDLYAGGYSKGSMSLGENSNATGTDNITYAPNSHAEGSYNYLGPSLSTDAEHAVGSDSADSSHAEGSKNTAVAGKFQHIEGYSNYSEGSYNHTEGTLNVNKGTNCHVAGSSNEILFPSCENDAVFGTGHRLLNRVGNSLVSGSSNSLGQDVSNVSVSGSEHDIDNATGSEITGYDHTIDGFSNSFVSGSDNNVKTASDSLVSGIANRLKNLTACFIHGCGIKTEYNTSYNAIFGRYNETEGSDTNAFVVANGTSDSDRRNILVLKKTGNLSVAGSVTSGSADLAEYFEWKDGNKKNQDRRGLFVTLDEDKIVLADNKTKYIVGCISAAPALIANNPHEWESKYKTDVFGSVIYDVVKDEKTGEEVRVPVLNEEYDASKTFIPRSERKEWGCVALHGRVVVVDDGSCEPNSYCRPIKNGIASKSDKGFRVLKRIDKTHILVWIEGSVTLD